MWSFQHKGLLLRLYGLNKSTWTCITFLVNHWVISSEILTWVTVNLCAVHSFESLVSCWASYVQLFSCSWWCSFIVICEAFVSASLFAQMDLKIKWRGVTRRSWFLDSQQTSALHLLGCCCWIWSDFLVVCFDELCIVFAARGSPKSLLGVVIAWNHCPVVAIVFIADFSLVLRLILTVLGLIVGDGRVHIESRLQLTRREALWRIIWTLRSRRPRPAGAAGLNFRLTLQALQFRFRSVLLGAAVHIYWSIIMFLILIQFNLI